MQRSDVAAAFAAVGIVDIADQRPASTIDDVPPPAGPDDYGLPGASDFERTPTPEEPRGSALKLTYFDDCGAFAQKRSILKGIIARGETLALIGPPGSGKSALMAEIVIHSAGGRDWRGHRAKEVCGWVVFALERGDLFRRRFGAYQQRDELQGLPIAVADAVIDLLHPNCVETIVATVREAEKQLGCSVGGIVIDTYAKGIAANGGDEDKARDQNRAAAHLRAVQGRIDVHISLVGHTGKDETRGARGSNAHVGDVDVMVQISGDTIKVAKVIKGNDQPERVVAQFKLEPYELGRDEDGDAITTAIVSSEEVEAQPPRDGEPKLTPNQRTVFGLLHTAGAAGLSLEDWNTQAKNEGIGVKRKADLTDIRKALQSKGLIRSYGDRWMVAHG